MRDTPTPGQCAYEAWRVHQRSGWLYERPLPWAQLDASTQAHWEAAAQAAIAQWWRDHETIICGEKERDDAC